MKFRTMGWLAVIAAVGSALYWEDRARRQASAELKETELIEQGLSRIGSITYFTNLPNRPPERTAPLTAEQLARGEFMVEKPMLHRQYRPVALFDPETHHVMLFDLDLQAAKLRALTDTEQRIAARLAWFQSLHEEAMLKQK